MLATLSTVIRFAITKKPGGFSRLLNAWREGVAGYFFSRSAMTDLSELDERALRDIGLNRSQIEAAVYGFVTIRNQGRR
jgi:uncharacterized protein YjiS (DUF1127 family)